MESSKALKIHCTIAHVIAIWLYWGLEDCGFDPMVRRQFSGETGPKDHFQGGVPNELQSLNATSIEAIKTLYYDLWIKTQRFHIFYASLYVSFFTVAWGNRNQ